MEATKPFRARGRPKRQHPRLKVTIDMDPAVYDEYCRRALTARQSVRRIMREVLTQHARS